MKALPEKIIDIIQQLPEGEVLTPGRYARFAEEEADGEPFDIKLQRLTDEFISHQKSASALSDAISTNLSRLFDVD